MLLINDNNIVISFDEYKIRYVDSKADASELRCICQSKLYYRKNSKPFQCNETRDISRFHHFIIKRSKCNFKAF